QCERCTRAGARCESLRTTPHRHHPRWWRRHRGRREAAVAAADGQRSTKWHCDCRFPTASETLYRMSDPSSAVAEQRIARCTAAVAAECRLSLVRERCRAVAPCGCAPPRWAAACEEPPPLAVPIRRRNGNNLREMVE